MDLIPDYLLDSLQATPKEQPLKSPPQWKQYGKVGKVPALELSRFESLAPPFTTCVSLV